MKELNRDFASRKKNILVCHKVTEDALKKALGHTSPSQLSAERTDDVSPQIESPEKRPSPVKEERKSVTRNHDQ